MSGVSTPAAQMRKSVSRASSQSGESSCRMTSRYRSDGTASIQSACTSFGTRSPSRRRSSMATQPECEAAQGTNGLDAARLDHGERVLDELVDTEVAGRRIRPSMSAPVEGEHSSAPARPLGDLLPALPTRAPAGQEEERRLAAAPVVVVDPHAVCLGLGPRSIPSASARVVTQQRAYPRRRERQAVDRRSPRPERVRDRVGDGGRGARDASFARALHAERVVRDDALDDHGVDRRQLGECRHRVVGKRQGQRVAVLVVRELLEERARDALRGAAGELATDDRRDSRRARRRARRRAGAAALGRCSRPPRRPRRRRRRRSRDARVRSGRASHRARRASRAPARRRRPRRRRRGPRAARSRSARAARATAFPATTVLRLENEPKPLATSSVS